MGCDTRLARPAVTKEISIQSILDTLSSASVRMRALAEAQDWEGLAGLEAARRLDLQALFARAPSAEEAAIIHERMQAVMAMDAEIMQLCKTARDEAGQQISRVHQGRRAEAAYNENR